MNINIAKIALLALSMVLLTLMVVAGKAEVATVLPIFTLIAGYAAGNGVQAFKGATPAPLFTNKDDRRFSPAED